MLPAIAKADLKREVSTTERCSILAIWNSPAEQEMSIARARVEPGVTTQRHALEGVTERYIIAEGRGRMEVGELPLAEVGPGDVVFVPAGVPQRITNSGSGDLVFYCVCTPRFSPECYRALE